MRSPVAFVALALLLAAPAALAAPWNAPSARFPWSTGPVTCPYIYEPVCCVAGGVPMEMKNECSCTKIMKGTVVPLVECPKLPSTPLPAPPLPSRLMACPRIYAPVCCFVDGVGMEVPNECVCANYIKGSPSPPEMCSPLPTKRAAAAPVGMAESFYGPARLY